MVIRVFRAGVTCERRRKRERKKEGGREERERKEGRRKERKRGKKERRKKQKGEEGVRERERKDRRRTPRSVSGWLWARKWDRTVPVWHHRSVQAWWAGQRAQMGRWVGALHGRRCSQVSGTAQKPLEAWSGCGAISQGFLSLLGLADKRWGYLSFIQHKLGWKDDRR